MKVLRFEQLGRRLTGHTQLVLAVLIVGGACAISWHIIRAPHRQLAYVPQTLSQCQHAKTKDYQCYAKYYSNKAYTQGSGQALTDMAAAYNSDEYVKAECHQLSHIVGRTAFEKTGSLDKAYADGNNFCWSGFYHGAIEQAIKQLGPDKIKQGAATVCESFANKKAYSLDHFNCVHGLGHGLMAVAGYNLHEGLKLCDKTITNWERQSCYGGVFMENVMVSIRGDGTSAFLDPTRLLYPCTAVATMYKQQCYLMQSSYILQHNGYDFASTFAECSKADADFVADCYQSIGRDAIGSVNNDIPRTIANCRTAPAGDTTALRNCMLGAEREFTSYYPHDKKVQELCAAFGPELETECRSDVASR